MAGVKKLEDLVAWQLAWELKQRVYAFTETGPASRDFKFCDDVRRAARSAPFNTSEGFYRYLPPEFRRFLRFARGSLGEVKDQLRHAREEKYLNESEFNDLLRLTKRAIGANTKLQNYLRSCPKSFDKQRLQRTKRTLNPEP
jgi:four helix bundle protein